MSKRTEYGDPRKLVLSADSHADARKRARKMMRGVYVRVLSTRRYCENGYILVYESRPR